MPMGMYWGWFVGEKSECGKLTVTHLPFIGPVSQTNSGSSLSINFEGSLIRFFSATGLLLDLRLTIRAMMLSFADLEARILTLGLQAAPRESEDKASIQLDTDQLT